MGPCNKINITHKNTKIRYNNKKQFNRTSVNNVSCKNRFVVSGLYPAEIRDSLGCNNDNNECDENISVENDTNLIVNAKINGCVGEVLFDSGAEISLMDKRLLLKHKNHFKKFRFCLLTTKL